MEAAHILQYTEDEFLQTLDWRPHAKADFHVCKKQPTDDDNESNDGEKNNENDEDEYAKKDDECVENGEDSEEEQFSPDNYMDEAHSEDLTTEL